MRTLVVLVLVLAGLGATSTGPYRQRTSRDERRFERREVVRLQAHFDSVLHELKTAPTEHLTPDRRQARTSLIAWLAEYRDAARFPRNRDVSVPAPYFRDATGRLCAMAYLVERSGRRDIVQRIATTDNNARIGELRNDPALGEWLDSTGLTLAEAARIQPMYSPRADEGVDGDYAFASAIVGASALASSAYNVGAPSRFTGWWGAVSGATALLLGVPGLWKHGDDRTLATANVAVGLVSTGLSLRGFRQRDRSVSEETSPESARRGREVTFAPVVVPVERRPTLGVGMRVSF